MLIQRAVLWEVISTFLAALSATTGLAFFMISIRFMERTPGVGMGFLVEIFPLFFPLALQFTVPLSMLAAAVMVFNRVAGDGELTALAATGVAVHTVARPVLAFAGAVALGAFLLTDVASPYASERLRAARRNLPHQLQTAFRSGLRDLDLGHARISFENFTGSGFDDVCVEYRPSEEKLELWRAQRGSIAVTDDERVVVALQHVRRVLPIRRRGGLEVYPAAGDIVVERSLAEVVAQGTRRRPRTSMKAWELAYIGDRNVSYGRTSSASARTELWMRSALAGSAFFFTLIGIPLGVRSARGGRIAAFLFGIGPVVLIYFPVVLTAVNLARSDEAPGPVIWIGNVIIGVLGFFLLRRMAKR